MNAPPDRPARKRFLITTSMRTPALAVLGRPFRAVLCALIVLAHVAACGGGDASPGPTDPPPTPVPALTGAVASPNTVSLARGQSSTLTISATVATGATVSIALTSNNTAVATVAGSAGQYTIAAVSSGSTTLTATVSASGTDLVTTSRTLQIPVTVLAPPVSSLTLDLGALSLASGLSTQATAVLRNVAGEVVEGLVVQWSSSDSSVARVDANGLIASGRPGTTLLEATSGGISASATLTVAAPPPNAACRLPTRTGPVSFGFPRSSARLRTTGTVRAAVLFVDFADAPATRSPQNVLNIIQPSAGAFFSAQSYGAMTLVLEPHLQWLRMPSPSTGYGWPNALTGTSHRALLQDAADLGAPLTDMRNADLLIVMTNPDAGAITFGPAFAANAGTGLRIPGRATTIDNATSSGRDLTGWGGLWLAHEMGHLMSLPDLYDYAPPPPNQAHLHVGEWSLMGLISGRGAEFTAFERWQLGWLADEQLVCAPATTSLVSLTPITQTGGVKAALVPLSATSALVVESRRAVGYDARVPQAGTLVYVINTQVASGRGTMRVQPAADTDQAKLTRVLTLGQSITLGGTTVTLVSQGDGTDVVRVLRP